LVRGPYYRVLQRLYRFDRWHIRPIEIRYYALDLCKHLNEFIAKQGLKTVVEIGCGIGDILARIKADRVIGFDLDRNVIRAGQFVHPRVEFHDGTFSDVRGQNIDVLIAVNFTHNIAPDELQREFVGVMANNKVKYIVVDSVDYTYFHNFDVIFGRMCEKVWQSKEFENKRRVLIYKNCNEQP